MIHCYELVFEYYYRKYTLNKVCYPYIVTALFLLLHALHREGDTLTIKFHLYHTHAHVLPDAHHL